MKHIVYLSLAVLLLTGCGKKKASDPLADSGRTQRTENLLTNMTAQAPQAIMFGHHDDTVYGIGWSGDDDRSDVRAICNDLPAVLSFDLGHIERGDSVNLDGVPFDRIRQEIFRHFQRGGVITLSWHADNPLTGESAWVKPDSLTDRQRQTVASILSGGEAHDKYLAWLDRLAEYFNSLETPYGVKVPVIFRPYHEHTGSWFWWGAQLCSREQYKQLWQLTVDRMKERGVTNVLWAYSPGTEPDGNAQQYLERYPGDKLIDLMGVDCYCDAAEGDSTALDSFATRLDRNLRMVCAVAQQHGKVAALTETGYEGLPTDDWWTHTLLPVLSHHALAYVLVWRNAHDKPGHFFAPYPGQRSTSDFVRFYNDRRTRFLHDINGLYLDPPTHNGTTAKP